jgi:uncharacterized protein YhbP (UPF0306 family)
MSLPPTLASIIPPDDLDGLLALLAETTTMTLATDPDGSPRNALFAASPLVELVFLSDPATPHARNVVKRPAVGAAAYPEVARWQEIRGVQMKGTAAPLHGDAAEQALALYGARFEFLAQVPAAFDRMSVYLFRPDWLRWIDNRRGFGASQEWGREAISPGDRPMIPPPSSSRPWPRDEAGRSLRWRPAAASRPTSGAPGRSAGCS